MTGADAGEGRNLANHARARSLVSDEALPEARRFPRRHAVLARTRRRPHRLRSLASRLASSMPAVFESLGASSVGEVDSGAAKMAPRDRLSSAVQRSRALFAAAASILASIGPALPGHFRARRDLCSRGRPRSLAGPSLTGPSLTGLSWARRSRAMAYSARMSMPGPCRGRAGNRNPRLAGALAGARGARLHRRGWIG